MFQFPKDEGRCRKLVQNSKGDDLRTAPIQKLCHYQLCITSTPAIEAFTAAMPVPFVQQQNVVAYMAGHLIR